MTGLVALVHISPHGYTKLLGVKHLCTLDKPSAKKILLMPWLEMNSLHAVHKVTQPHFNLATSQAPSFASRLFIASQRTFPPTHRYHSRYVDRKHPSPRYLVRFLRRHRKPDRRACRVCRCCGRHLQPSPQLDHRSPPIERLWLRRPARHRSLHLVYYKHLYLWY